MWWLACWISGCLSQCPHAWWTDRPNCHGLLASCPRITVYYHPQTGCVSSHCSSGMGTCCCPSYVPCSKSGCKGWESSGQPSTKQQAEFRNMWAKLKGFFCQDPTKVSLLTRPMMNLVGIGPLNRASMSAMLGHMARMKWQVTTWASGYNQDLFQEQRRYLDFAYVQDGLLDAYVVLGLAPFVHEVECWWTALASCSRCWVPVAPANACLSVGSPWGQQLYLSWSSSDAGWGLSSPTSSMAQPSMHVMYVSLACAP